MLSVLSNPIVAGGLTLMLSGAVLAIFRGIPATIWRALQRQSMIRLEIVDTDPLFPIALQWLDADTHIRNTRILSLVRGKKLSPAPGDHLFFWKSRLVWLSRTRKELETAWCNEKYTETLQFRFFCRSRAIVEAFIASLDAERTRAQAKSSYLWLPNNGGNWRQYSKLPRRDLATVVLQENLKEELLRDINWFLTNEPWYAQRCLPYRRGYLLHGPPGTGKSSLVLALADALKLDLCTLNLSAMTDGTLTSLILDLPEKAMLLLEDVDCVKATASRTPVDSNAPTVVAETLRGVSLSCVLNCLDGVLSHNNGSLVFLTTNHPEKLDPALLRPGRVDKRIGLSYLTKEQAKKLVVQLCGEIDAIDLHDFLQAPRTPAELTQLCMEKLAI